MDKFPFVIRPQFIICTSGIPKLQISMNRLIDSSLGRLLKSMSVLWGFLIKFVTWTVGAPRLQGHRFSIRFPIQIRHFEVWASKASHQRGFFGFLDQIRHFEVGGLLRLQLVSIVRFPPPRPFWRRRAEGGSRFCCLPCWMTTFCNIRIRFLVWTPNGLLHFCPPPHPPQWNIKRDGDMIVFHHVYSHTWQIVGCILGKLIVTLQSFAFQLETTHESNNPILGNNKWWDYMCFFFENVFACDLQLERWRLPNAHYFSPTGRPASCRVWQHFLWTAFIPTFFSTFHSLGRRHAGTFGHPTRNQLLFCNSLFFSLGQSVQIESAQMKKQ